MTREIKFRGFNRKNQTWLYGYYLQNRGAHFVCPDEFADGKTWDDYEVRPDTVGQYTGLTDKNGREIFEGDIIVHASGSSIRYVVEWHNTELVGKQISSSSYAGISHWIDVTEVIGNVHDNPELMNTLP